MARRRTSISARLAAPAALLAAFIAVVVVVRPPGEDEPDASPPAAAETTPRTTTGEERPSAPAKTTPAAESDGPATYTVQAGDTFSAIAAETGVPVEELVELNPDANPSALTVGEELKLRDSGSE